MDARKNIFTAIEENDHGTVKKLINGGIDLTQQNTDDLTPIEFAMNLASSDDDYWPIVDSLAAEAAKKHDDDDQANCTEALPHAIKAKKNEIAKHLLQAGADPSWTEDDSKPSNLHIAIQEDNLEGFKLLLEYDADITLTFENDTPAQLADALEKTRVFEINRKLHYST